VLGPTARPIGGTAGVCCFARCAACRLSADFTGQTSADSCGYVDVTWTYRVVLCVCCMLLSSVVFCIRWGDVRLLAPPMHCAMTCSVLCVILASPTCHLLGSSSCVVVSVMHRYVSHILHSKGDFAWLGAARHFHVALIWHLPNLHMACSVHLTPLYN
jgi:hypothetical protein